MASRSRLPHSSRTSLPCPELSPMLVNEIAWRGFVTQDLQVVAWPMLLADHATFHRTFGTSDADFAARWRQWWPERFPEFDPGAPPEAVQAVKDWLNESS